MPRTALRSRLLRPRLVPALLATLASIAALPALASAAAPLTDQQLAAAINARNPALIGIDEAVVSPDGQRLAVVADVDVDGSGPSSATTEQLWLVSADGTRVSRLEAAKSRAARPSDSADQALTFDFSAIQWSPNSRFLAFQLQGNGWNVSLWSLLDLSLGTANVKASIHDAGHATFAPDSSEVSVDQPGAPSGAPRFVRVVSLAATLPSPTEEWTRLNTLIDGRIDGLSDFDGITTRQPDGRIAFHAWIGHPESLSVDSSIWTISPDGQQLVEVEGLGPGSSNYNILLSAPAWSATGRFLTYRRYGLVGRVHSSTAIRDLSTLNPTVPDWSSDRWVLSADDTLAVSSGFDGRATVYNLTTGREFVAVELGNLGSGGWGYRWTAACQGAARSNAPISTRDGELSLGPILAQVVASPPGCRAEPWPADLPAPTPTTPTTPPPTPLPTPLPGAVTPQLFTGDSIPQPSRSATSLSEPLVRVLSARAARKHGSLTAIRVKVSAPLPGRVKLHVIVGTGDGAWTLARGSAVAPGTPAPIVLTLPVSRKANAALTASGASSVTLRAAAINGDGQRAIAERPLVLSGG